ncbi:MAG TPA: hypothetical protein PKI37_04535 [Candidatus Cloacimonas sp.]|nr:hypothetical protein [Candidatus Cloacimonas sp.]
MKFLFLSRKKQKFGIVLTLSCAIYKEIVFTSDKAVKINNNTEWQLRCRMWLGSELKT